MRIKRNRFWCSVNFDSLLQTNFTKCHSSPTPNSHKYLPFYPIPTPWPAINHGTWDVFVVNKVIIISLFHQPATVTQTLHSRGAHTEAFILLQMLSKHRPWEKKWFRNLFQSLLCLPSQSKQRTTICSWFQWPCKIILQFEQFIFWYLWYSLSNFEFNLFFPAHTVICCLVHIHFSLWLNWDQININVSRDAFGF